MLRINILGHIYYLFYPYLFYFDIFIVLNSVEYHSSCWSVVVVIMCTNVAKGRLLLEMEAWDGASSIFIHTVDSTGHRTPLTVGFYWYWYWHTTWMWVLVVTSELSSTNTSAGGYKWTHRSAQHTICFNQRITTLRNDGRDLSQMMKHTYLMVFVEQHETRMSSQKGWRVKEKRRRNLKQKAFVTIVTTCQRGYTDLHRRYIWYC